MHEKQIRLNFEKRFMQKIYSKDKYLNEFLVRNFYIVNRNKPNRRGRFKKNFTKDYKTKHHTQLEVDRKVKLLEHLTVGEKKVAKARLKQLEENNDVSKFFPSLIAIIAALLLSINIISGWVIDTAKIEETNKKEEVAAEEIKTEGESSSNSEILSKIPNPLILLSIAVILAIGIIIWYTIKLKRIYSHRSIAIYINSLLEDTLTNKNRS